MTEKFRRPDSIVCLEILVTCQAFRKSVFGPGWISNSCFFFLFPDTPVGEFWSKVCRFKLSLQVFTKLQGCSCCRIQHTRTLPTLTVKNCTFYQRIVLYFLGFSQLASNIPTSVIFVDTVSKIKKFYVNICVFPTLKKRR